jgi:hypothetical protein
MHGSSSLTPAGVAFYGVVQQLGRDASLADVSFADSLCVFAPGKPRARLGKKIEQLPMAAVPNTSSSSAAASSTSSAAASSTSSAAASTAEGVVRPDGWACRLANGCTQRHGHAGLCTPAEPYVRTPDRVNYAALNGSARRGTKRPANDPAS